MKRLGKSRGGMFAAALAVAVMLGFGGRASADTKPKFVYVTNSGDTDFSFIAKTFQVTATATCTSRPCASMLSVSGTLTVNSFGGATTGTMFVTDSNDVAASPLGLPMGYNPVAYYTNPNLRPVFFGVNSATASNVTLAFPFTGISTSFPSNYSGGMLCTVNSSSGCPILSGVVIAPKDMSPSLLASSGGIPITAQITGATVTQLSNSQGSNTVSGYTVDSATGALTLIPGSPFATGSNPTGLVVDPSNKFVYVANQDSNNISAYAVNSTTGVLAPVAGSPFAAGTTPHSIAIDPSGKFVYVANEGSNNVSAYTIDSETGALTVISGSPFKTGTSPVWVTIDPVAHFVYVLNSDLIRTQFSTSGFTFDTTTGALIPITGVNFDTGYGPIAAVADPSGKFLFECSYFGVNWGAGPISINNTTGALTIMNFGGTGGGDVLPSALALHPSGKFFYATDASFQPGYIVAYSVDSTGKQAIIPGSADDDYAYWDVPAGPYATGSKPHSILVDPSGKFAYVGNQGSNDISAYTINALTGALTPLVGSPFAAGIGPTSVGIVSSPASVAFNKFKIDVNIDEDRKTSFRIGGFFILGDGSDGIYPLSEPVELQVGSYSVTLPAGSFREHGRHQFEYEGRINDVEVRIHIYQTKAKEHLFTAEAKGDILKGIKNPVAVGLTIGDDEGSVTVKADIEK